MIRKKLKYYLGQVLKFGFGFGIFGYFVASGRIDLTNVKQGLFHSPWMLVALAMGGVALLTVTLRWMVLLKSQGIHLTFGKALRLVFIGHFFNIVIPGTVSGDVVKVYYVTRRKENKLAAGFSVLMDRFIGMIVLVMVTCVAVRLNNSLIESTPELKLIARAIALAGIGVCIGFSFFLLKKDFSLSERWPTFLRNLTDAFWSYRRQLPTLFLAMIFAILNYAVNVFFFFASARAIGELALPFSQYLFLVPIGFFVMSIPISPVGLGVGQGVFLKLFEWSYGRPISIGADIITLFQIVVVLWALVGLLVYVLSRHEVSVSAPSVVNEKEAPALS